MVKCRERKSEKSRSKHKKKKNKAVYPPGKRTKSRACKTVVRRKLIMKYTTKAAEKSTVKIKMTFDKDEWIEAQNKAYVKERGRFAVNGFRKGKAPKNVIEHAYGKGVFYEEG